MESGSEQVLDGGNVAGAAVRVGAVRRRAVRVGGTMRKPGSQC